MKTFRELTGDGGSNVMGQVLARKGRIETNLAGIKRIVAVGSGKGGVGKSTLTMQLAVALAADGGRVAILDADLNGPAQARMGGLKQQAPLPGPRGLLLPQTPSGIGIVSMGAYVPESEAVAFPSGVTSDSYLWRATKEFTFLGSLLESVDWGERDFLLVDLPPGAERMVQYADFLGPATAFVMVTIPGDVARGVVARAIAALRAMPNRLLGVVENMRGYYCADCGAVKPLFPSRSAVALDAPELGGVPFDPELAACCDRGGSILDLAETGATRLAVQAVAGRILEELEKTP
jgi:ATP-binding protein involved in chromosome partitioning